MKRTILLSLLLIFILKEPKAVRGMGSMTSMAGGAAGGKTDEKTENSTVNVTNEDGAMDKEPAVGALVEVVNRNKMERDITETLSEMRDKMNNLMENVNSRLQQIEEAGIFYILF